MQLITTEEQIRKLIPNVLLSVKGEVPLIDKLTPFLNLAEEWVKQVFTSETVFVEICKLTEADLLRTFASKVIVCEAFRNAVPSLDLVLTPNGFGIVNNSNVVPASRDRVARLIDSLEAERDRAIRLLLTQLCGTESWQTTLEHDFFTSTMFPNLDVCDYLSIREHQWDKYQELRSVLISIEDKLAANYLSPELIQSLRCEVSTPSGTASLVRRQVIKSIRALLAKLLRIELSGTTPQNSLHYELTNIVNVIQNHPDDFTEWHNSSVVLLFSPVIYKNKKKDGGYWF